MSERETERGLLVVGIDLRARERERQREREREGERERERAPCSNKHSVHLSTEMSPMPTSGVMVEVKTLLLCTRKVKTAPAKMAM